MVAAGMTKASARRAKKRATPRAGSPGYLLFSLVARGAGAEVNLSECGVFGIALPEFEIHRGEMNVQFVANVQK
jgi:hypothetical protein